MDFGISGSSAPTTSQRASTANTRAAPQKRAAPASPGAGHADEIPLGSGLPSGLSDVELENICRLQYARWSSIEEYVSSVGCPPDVWPDSGLYKSTKKKGDECKFYWKKVPEWKHMWNKASGGKAA